MVGESTILWVGGERIPPDVQRAAGGRTVTRYRPDRALAPQVSQAGLALVQPNGEAEDPRRLGRLLDELDRSTGVALFLVPPRAQAAWNVLTRRSGQHLCLAEDADAAQIKAALDTAASLQPTIRDLQAELAEARRLTGGEVRLDRLDEELRLAARLQRDFLPRRLPEVGDARFAVLYRPAGWVSGDIYDIARLDETHVGFYVLDAVGHGMPAALFTMFVKSALVSKRIAGHSYQIVPPHASLTELNDEICGQNFSTFPFCTALYGVLDTRTRTLTYCRAGHPEALLVRDGEVTPLEGPGSLLGVFPDEQYGSRDVELRAGDRVVLYTDGVESALPTGDGRLQPFENVLRPWADLPRDELLLRITSEIEARSPQAPEADDVTVLVLEMDG